MTYPALGALFASTVSTAAAGPVVRAWLHHQQTIDLPNERSSHTVPTPRGGGLACAFGAVAGSIVARYTWSGASVEWLGASAILGAVGRLDDVAGLPPVPRLSLQVAVGAGVGARSGGALGATVGAFVMPAIVNAFNFMDGINGISGGTAAAWGASVASRPTRGAITRAQGAVTAGMGLGFLPYNIPNASMFLGDVGSYLLGGGIAATVIQSSFNRGRPDLDGAFSAVAPLAPYLADTGATIVMRASRGESITQAHREHAYQRLVQETGWPHWGVASLVSAAAAACGALGQSSKGRVAIAPIVALYLAAPVLARAAGRARG